jgi:hypothetical protein
MNPTESTFRVIKDRIATALGDVDEAAVDVMSKDNYRRLAGVAKELHRCADDIQNILMRIKPRAQ